MRHKLYQFIAIVGILCSSTEFLLAGTVSKEVAKAKAIEFLTKSANKAPSRGGASNQSLQVKDLNLAYTSEKEGRTCFYVFNNGADNGFVIVGGDDAAKDILAYVPQGHFDYDNAPENFKWWISQYENTICGGHNTATSTQTGNPNSAFYDIPDLITTKWGQDYPYNSSIPEEDGIHYPTGCVPTALAQIMKYWNYPASGIGSHQDMNHPSFSVNFESAQYDWGNMLDSYSGDFNEAQANAVSTLMYHVGVASDIIYTESWSGHFDWYSDDTFVEDDGTQALVSYFGYDEKLRSLARGAYSLSEWKTLIFDELASSRPVYYSGAVKSGDGYEGHGFVCHGYSASLDMFSFNWGWEGFYDGYFAITETNDIFYNENYTEQSTQSIAIGIQPPNETPSDKPQYGDLFTYDGIEYAIFSPTLRTVSVAKVVNNREEYVIPNSVKFKGETYTVTRIDHYAFKNNTLTKITLPEQLITIGFGAFRECYNLSEITIPEGTTNIEGEAFCYCHSLEKVELPSTISEIGPSAFYYAPIKEIRLPESLNYLFSDSFANCEKLEKVVIPKNIKTIHISAFDGCCNLNYLICEAATPPIIEYYSLTSAIIRQTFTYMQKKGILFVPRESVELYKNAWIWKDFMDIVPIETFDDYHLGERFEYEGLKYVVIPNGVELTGSSKPLSPLTVPSNVEYDGKQYPVISIGYNSFAFSQVSSLTIPEGIKEIKPKAFQCCPIKEINFPNSIERIGAFAFSDIQIENLVLPNNLQELRNSAFSHSSTLAKVTIPHCDACDGCFTECTSLKEAYLGAGLYQCIFNNCDSLQRVVLSKDVELYEDYDYNKPLFKEMVCFGTGDSEEDLPAYYLDVFKTETGGENYCMHDGCPFSEYQADGTLYVPKECISLYQSSNIWNMWGNIKPIVPLSKIVFDVTSFELEVGQNRTLDITATPSNATVTHCIWSSSDPTIATVDQNGVVTAITDGTATITATSMYYPDIKASCTVTVLPKLCKITYIVDGEVYKTESIKCQTKIELPNAPKKEGHTFYRWEGMPEDLIMPDHDLTVTAQYAITGDVNLDEKVNITDAVDIVNDRLGYESNGFILALSDINADEQYTITDAIGVINIMYGEPVGSNASARDPETPCETLALRQYDDFTLAIDMNSMNRYSAFQFDIELPQGITLDGVSLNTDRCMSFAIQYNNVCGNCYKVVAYNFANEPLTTGNDILLRMNLSDNNGSDEVRVSNIHFSTCMATDVQFDDMSLSLSISGILNKFDDPVGTSNIYYNIYGQRIANPTKGIFLHNGKMIVNQ